MGKLAGYGGNVTVISGLTQANGLDFPLVEANAVVVDDKNTRLDELITHMNVPIGAVIMWYGDNIPDGWIPISGQELQKLGIYAELYNIFGDEYGSTQNTFFLPNQNDKIEYAPNTIKLPFNYIIKYK